MSEPGNVGGAHRRWAARRTGATHPDDLRAPWERPLTDLLRFGVLAVDKPSGPTSHDVVEEVNRLLGVGKAGHGGTLDPGVTGVLPVFLGGATRLSSLLLRAGKEYVALMRLHAEVSPNALESATAGFRGRIEQMPPVRSRVKRVWRERSVYALEILALEGREAVLRVSCEAGTYVRKLIHDLGEALGTGAHMAALRRTRAGVFVEEEAVTLARLREAFVESSGGGEARLRSAVHPGERLAALVPRIVMDAGAVGPVASGTALALPGVIGLEVPFGKGDDVALLGPDGIWIALAKALADAGDLESREKGLVAAPRRVFRSR